MAPFDVAWFDELVGTNDLALYLSAVQLQHGAQQYIPTAAQEAEAARYLQNAQDNWLAQYNAYNSVRNYAPLCPYPLPAGWRDWFDCGDELV